MRIWDIPCSKLCRQHLLGEHRELHGLFNIITTDKGSSYRKHPETLRWFGKAGLLSERHSEQVKEMEARGYKHKSPLPEVDYGEKEQKVLVNTIQEQVDILKNKKCECRV